MTSTGGIRPGRTGEVMVAIRGGVEAFLAQDADNGEQGILEIIAQVIGQAGPALEMARDALARTRNGDGAAKPRVPEESPPA